MRAFRTKLMRTAVLAGVAAVFGCASDDHTPPPPRAPIPPVCTYTTVAPPMAAKPLPEADPSLMNRPPFADEPLVTQTLPEQAAFLGTYERVGRPRITLFVNRSLGGNIVPTNPGGPTGGVERTREATGAVKTEVDGTQIDPYGRPIGGQHDRFETTGPATVRDRTENYLAPGQYDEVSARRIDYDAVEAALADWFAAGGRVSLVTPRLTDGGAGRLSQGRPEALTDLSKDVDVLIQVQARPTGQTPQGLSVRLIAEAMNTRGGDSLGRAFVDVPPPLEKNTLNEYTRFLARKLMSDMTQTWSNPRPANGTTPVGVPATQP